MTNTTWKCHLSALYKSHKNSTHALDFTLGLYTQFSITFYILLKGQFHELIINSEDTSPHHERFINLKLCTVIYRHWVESEKCRKMNFNGPLVDFLLSVSEMTMSYERGRWQCLTHKELLPNSAALTLFRFFSPQILFSSALH